VAVNDLFNEPHDNATWAIWSWHHRDSHKRILQAIQAQTGLILTEFVLEPITSDDITGFLQRNSQMHLDMDGIAGVSSNNLQDVDFKNKAQFTGWIALHAQEHLDVERRLNL
jgi:hypothetical protein